jgi:hypothetical protein
VSIVNPDPIFCLTHSGKYQTRLTCLVLVEFISSIANVVSALPGVQDLDRHAHMGPFKREKGYGTHFHRESLRRCFRQLSVALAGCSTLDMSHTTLGLFERSEISKSRYHVLLAVVVAL